MLARAAVIDISTIRCMLSLPPLGELLNICAGMSPRVGTWGK
jgi:hypothetical protein